MNNKKSSIYSLTFVLIVMMILYSVNVVSQDNSAEIVVDAPSESSEEVVEVSSEDTSIIEEFFDSPDEEVIDDPEPIVDVPKKGKDMSGQPVDEVVVEDNSEEVVEEIVVDEENDNDSVEEVDDVSDGSDDGSSEDVETEEEVGLDTGDGESAEEEQDEDTVEEVVEEVVDEETVEVEEEAEEVVEEVEEEEKEEKVEAQSVASVVKDSKKLPSFGYALPDQSGFGALHVQSTQLQGTEPIPVIVWMKDPKTIKEWRKYTAGMTPAEIESLESVMRGYAVWLAGQDNVKHQFTSFEGFSAKLTPQEIGTLLGTGLVADIKEDTKVQKSLAQSVPLINASDLWKVQLDGTNLTGKGQSICVIDTGVNYSHPDLGGCTLSNQSAAGAVWLNVTESAHNYSNSASVQFNITNTSFTQMSVHFVNISTEQGFDYVSVFDGNDNLVATYSGNLTDIWTPTVQGDTIVIELESDGSGTDYGFYIDRAINGTGNITEGNWSTCNKVIWGWDVVNYDANPVDDDDHGTHVAGIAAANGQVMGVAPNASIVAIKALDANGSGFSSDIIAGIEMCNSHAQQYNISVITMSLGSNINASTYCDGAYSGYSEAINDSVADNISVVIASGNDGNYTGIDTPACIFNAIPVGATNKSDALALFSNRNSLVQLMAPGVTINSTFTNGTHGNFDGTSMATPHVAGAIALLRQALALDNASMTPAQLEDVLNDTGVAVNDSFSMRNYSRIDVLAAYNFISQSQDFTLDKVANVSSATVGSVVGFTINITNDNGAANFSNLTVTDYFNTSIYIFNGSQPANQSYREENGYGIYSWNITTNLSVGGSYTINVSLIANRTNQTPLAAVNYVNVSVNFSDNDVQNATENEGVNVLADPGFAFLSVISQNVTNETANITWTTTQASNSSVAYGSNLANMHLVSELNDSNTTHAIILSGLNASTTYYYNLTSCLVNGSCITNGSNSFTTLANGGGMGPGINYTPMWSLAINATNFSNTSLFDFNGAPYVARGPGCKQNAQFEEFLYPGQGCINSKNESFNGSIALDLGAVWVDQTTDYVAWNIVGDFIFNQTPSVCSGQETNVSYVVEFDTDDNVSTGCDNGAGEGCYPGADYQIWYHADTHLVNFAVYNGSAPGANGKAAGGNCSNNLGNSCYVHNASVPVMVNLTCDFTFVSNETKAGVTGLVMVVNKSHLPSGVKLNFETNSFNETQATSNPIDQLTDNGFEPFLFDGPGPDAGACWQWDGTNQSACESNSESLSCTWTDFGNGDGLCDPDFNNFAKGSACFTYNNSAECGGSELGICEWLNDTFAMQQSDNGLGLCVEQFKPAEFGAAGSCDDDCAHCYTQTQCEASDANGGQLYGGCAWYNDSFFADGFCGENGVKFGCADTPDNCYSNSTCTGAGWVWNATWSTCVESSGIEICSNGFDDDGNGLTDCQESYCQDNAKNCGAELDTLTGDFQGLTGQDALLIDLIGLNPEVITLNSDNETDGGANTTELVSFMVVVTDIGLGMGIQTENTSDLVTCGGAISDRKFMYMMDTDGNTSTGCNITLDGSNHVGFDYSINYGNFSWVNSTENSTKQLYACFNNTWILRDAALVSVTSVFPTNDSDLSQGFTKTPLECEETDPQNPELEGGSTMGVVVDKLDVGNPTGDMRFTVVSVNGSWSNYSNVSTFDIIEDNYYTPGSVGFTPVDCTQEPTECGTEFMLIGEGKFMPSEDCFEPGDEDLDGLNNCADPDCIENPICLNAPDKYNVSNDISAPKVKMTNVDSFDDAAFVFWHTNEPTNASIKFYHNDSACGTLNTTIPDLGGIDDSGVDDFKPWHNAPLDNRTLGYSLSASTTYYYKLNSTDKAGNPSISTCLNFTTASQPDNVSLLFDFVPPTGNASEPLGNLSVEINDQPLALGSFAEQEDAGDVNITIRNPTASKENNWSIEFVGVDIFQDIELNFSDGFLANDTGEHGNLVGMGNQKWLDSAQNLGVEYVIVEVPTTGDKLFHCLDNGTDCTDVSGIEGVERLEETGNRTRWKVPTTTGFSSYSVGNTTYNVTFVNTTLANVSVGTLTNGTITLNITNAEIDNNRTYNFSVSAPANMDAYINNTASMPNTFLQANESILINITANANTSGRYTVNVTATLASNGSIILNSTDDLTLTFDVSAVDSTAPTITLVALANNSVNATAAQILTYNATDASGNITNCSLFTDGVLNQTATSITSGALSNFSAKTFVEGSHNWSVDCFDGSSNGQNSSTYYFTIDTTNPRYFDLNESPSDPATYTAGATYQFNATINDTVAIDDVWIGFNGTNYSGNDITNNGDNYRFNRTDLSVGVFNYTWYFNDTAGNFNQTAAGVGYTVNQATPLVHLNFTNNATTFGTSVSVTCGSPVAEVNASLYRNGTIVDGANETVTLGAGYYTYNCSTVATQNYTAVVNGSGMIISQATDNINMSINGVKNANTSIIVGNNFTVEVNSSSGTDGVVYVAGTAYNQSTNISLSVGSYVIVANTTGNANYTGNATGINYTLTVNKTASVVNLTLNGTDGNVTIPYGTTINLTSTLVTGEGSNMTMRRDGSIVQIGAGPLTNATTFATPGTSNITVIYNETQNYSQSSETHFVIVTDSVAPVVTPMTPANNTFNASSTVALAFNATDLGSGIGNCSIYINGTLNASNTSMSEGVNDFDVTFADGHYTWYVTCYDNVTSPNSATSATWTIKVDTTAPTTTLSGASQGQFFSDNVSLTLTGADGSGSGVNYTAYSLDGANETNYTAAFNATGEGQHTLNYHSVDDLSNTESNNSINFTIDLTGPFVNITSPSNDSWVTGTVPKLNYTVVDNLSSNVSCNLSINSNLFGGTINNNTEVQVSVNTTTALASNTQYNWNVTCADLANNTGSSATYVIGIDSTLPSSSITLNTTANSAGWRNAITSFNISASDSGSGVSHVQYKNASAGSWYNATTNFTFATSLADDLIYFRAVDIAGNSEVTKQASFKYDGTAPTINEVRLSTVNVSQAANVTVYVNATDAKSGLASSGNVTVNGTTTTLTLSSGWYTGTITAPSTDGLYNLTVSLLDNADNTVTNTLSQIRVNSSIPTISTSIPSNTTVSNVTALTITFGNMTNASYNLTGSSATTTTSSSASVNISGAEGRVTLEIHANNSAANVTKYITYIIDATVPNVAFSGITNGQDVNGSLDIATTASDGSGVASVKLLVNGSTYATDTLSPFTFTYPTTALADGAVNFTLNVTDNVGLQNSTTYSLVINNTVPVVASVAGDTDSSAGMVTSDDLVGTPVETLVDTITGLNDTSVTITVYENTSNDPSSEQLDTVIGRLNISTDTAATSRVYVTIPITTLSGLGMSSPFSDIAFYADHGNGTVVGPLTSAYVDNVTKETVQYARFYFETDDYSLFFFGEQGTATSSPSGGSSGGGGGGGGSAGGSLITANGVLKTLFNNQKFMFKITTSNGLYSTYDIRVIGLGETAVTYTLVGKDYTLNDGATATYDLDGDGRDDLSIFVNTLSSSHTKLLFQNVVGTSTPAPTTSPVTSNVVADTTSDSGSSDAGSEDTSAPAPSDPAPSAPAAEPESDSKDSEEVEDEGGMGWLFWILILLVLIVIGLFVYEYFRFQKKKKMMSRYR